MYNLTYIEVDNLSDAKASWLVLTVMVGKVAGMCTCDIIKMYVVVYKLHQNNMCVMDPIN